MGPSCRSCRPSRAVGTEVAGGAREVDAGAAATRLSDAQIERYARHILLREVGGRGQARLLAGALRVTGCGRAAEEAAGYLAAAGVGRIGLEAALIARVGEHLGAMNPDVVVVAPDEAGEVDADAAVVAAAGEDRGAGALAALEALMVLAGVRAVRVWEYGA